MKNYAVIYAGSPHAEGAGHQISAHKSLSLALDKARKIGAGSSNYIVVALDNQGDWTIGRTAWIDGVKCSQNLS